MPPTKLALEALQADRLYVQHQIAASEDSPTSTRRIMWEQRLAAIEEEIAAVDASWTSLANVAVFFDGVPVIGAHEIQLDFAADALDAYQGFVSTVFAARLNDAVPQRGTLPGAARSRLYIRDIARGSMGFILEELPSDQPELVPSLLSEVVEESTQIIDSLSTPDESLFEARLENKSQRLIAALGQFASVLHDAKASTKIVGSVHTAALSMADVARLAGRLSEVTTTEEVVLVNGRILGVFPASRRFEFESSTIGSVLRGSVSESFGQKWLADDAFREQVLLRPSVAMFKHLRSIRNDTEISSQYSLEAAEPLPTANPVLALV